MSAAALRAQLDELFAEALAGGLDWQDIDDACQGALAEGEDPDDLTWTHADDEED